MSVCLQVFLFLQKCSNLLKTTKLMQNTKLNTHICYVVNYVHPSKNSHIMSNFNYYKMAGV